MNKVGDAMLTKLKELIQKAVKKLIPSYDIRKKMNIDIAMSSDMTNAIQLWTDIVENNAPWINEKKGVFSLEIAHAICKEFTDTSVNELKSKIGSSDFLNDQYQYVIDDIDDWLQLGLMKGGIALKPYISGNEIMVDYVQADKFYPVEYDSRKRITAAIFVEQLVKGKYIYTRLEFQKFNIEKQSHTFINLAFQRKKEINSQIKLDSLGNPIDLKSVAEWSSLETEFTIGNVNRPLFAYWKVPGINTIDFTSPLGVPVYKKAINLIEEADKQYSRYLWEYEGGELAIDASEDIFEKRKNEIILPSGKERLYRSYDIDVAKNDKFIDVYAPTLRDSNYADGFNNILKRIEFNCGLSYGDLSDPQAIEKTAEEIKTSKQRKYTSVTSIQNSLEKVLNHVAYIMSVYAVGMNKVKGTNVQLEISWGDSVLIDSEKQRTIDLQEVNAGLLPRWKYKVKWQGMSEQEAKAEEDNTNQDGVEF